MDDRATGIGSSDIAAIVGQHPYRTPYSVYAEKVGQLVVPQNERMLWGKKLQRIVAEEWGQRNKVAISWLDETYRTKPEYFMATPDAKCVGTVGNGDVEGIEVKTADWRQRDLWGEPGTDSIPAWYLLQCQWQAMVMGWKRVYVPVLFGGNQLESYTVEFDPALAEELAKRAEAFWTNHVRALEPPEMDWTEAAKASIRQRFPKAVSPEYRDATTVEDELVAQLAKLKRQQIAVTRAYDTQVNKVKEAIGDWKGIRGSGFVVSFFNVKGSRYMVERKPGRSFRARGEIFDEVAGGEE